MRAQAFADMLIVGDKPAQMLLGPFAGIGDTDSRVGCDLIVRYGSSALEEEVLALAHVDPGERFVDGEGLAEFGRAVAKIALLHGAFGVFAGAVSEHGFDALGGFEGPDEDGVREVDFAGGNIHAVVHAVGEVDIGGAGRSVHGLGSFSAAAFMGVSGFVFWTEIGLGFDDDACEACAVGEDADEPGTEEGACEFVSGSGHEPTAEGWHGVTIGAGRLELPGQSESRMLFCNLREHSGRDLGSCLCRKGSSWSVRSLRSLRSGTLTRCIGWRFT